MNVILQEIDRLTALLKRLEHERNEWIEMVATTANYETRKRYTRYAIETRDQIIETQELLNKLKEAENVAH